MMFAFLCLPDVTEDNHLSQCWGGDGSERVSKEAMRVGVASGGAGVKSER